MSISLQIEAVYQRALLLRQRATENPVQHDLMSEALKELYFVLEELQTSDEELQLQNQALVRTHHDLRVERQRYQDLFDLAPDGYIVTDRKGIIQEANYAIASMLQASQDFLIGKPLVLFVTEEARAEFHTKLLELCRFNGSDKPRMKDWHVQICPRHDPPFEGALTLSITRDLAGKVSSFRWLFRDITQQKQTEATIRHQAFYDTLTGLPNRAFFNACLPQVLAQADRQQALVALLFLDLDEFKAINDTLGHAVGDLLLQEVAQRLSTCFREGDTLVRWGGDEFTVILHPVETAEAVADACERVLESLREPFEIHSHPLHISTSIGVSLFPHDGRDAETLLRHADVTLYQAKDAGRNTYRFYTASMNADAAEALLLENELYQALGNREFRLYFQPQLDSVTGSVVGMEALLRWQHPRLGLLSPESFLKLAERTGLIIAIGEWVLSMGIAQAQIWHSLGFGHLTLGINLSARQFHHPQLMAQIQRAVEAVNYDPTCLELEITETVALRKLKASQEMMAQLRVMGVKISLDDFGTGYSALHALKVLPLDRLKIDRSFITELVDSPPDQAIAIAIIALAQGLFLDVVAEGVETEAQATLLNSLGCAHMQGYWFSHPLSEAGAIDFLTQHRNQLEHQSA
ncbi:putative bifunctional diguanylate cyclase/phosphodiesterase [Leptolyngbya sp. PCC 6406]|uniref:putative bifunctional diguanylate cyclase/phosphodiesterase n=1 Tax=Leptolyngbya sp. PCC 6406 TaxID=1173264 RepID=UPI0002AC25C5|nr:EAL domain-containing protein [Leptolyngbya sp. PCC 6406]